MGHDQPANLPDYLVNIIKRIIDISLKKIGVTNGACHTEIKIKNGKIYLIEFNARPGGDHISWPLVDLSTGIHYIQEVIKIACDNFDAINLKKVKKGYAGVRFITKQTEKLQQLFEICESFSWCYEKHETDEKLISLKNNNGYNINYLIYKSNHPINIEKIAEEISKNNTKENN